MGSITYFVGFGDVLVYGRLRLNHLVFFTEKCLPCLPCRYEISYWDGISAVRRNPLRPALVRSVCVLHADRVRLAHLSQGISGHPVWARGDSTGRAYSTAASLR